VTKRWQEVIARNGAVITMIVKTGGGGSRLVFKHPRGGRKVGNRQESLPGADVRVAPVAPLPFALRA
jgi:hypothetical protein